MSMSFDALSDQAMALPFELRYELVQRLWHSIEGQLSDEDAELFAEIERREAEVASGAVEVISYEQSMREIRDSLK